MSSINGLGQRLLHYFQNTKINSAHEGIEPIASSDEDGDGNAGAPRDERANIFGRALLATLKKHNIDPEQFRAEFMAAMHELTMDQSAESTSIPHVNAVG